MMCVCVHKRHGDAMKYTVRTTTTKQMHNLNKCNHFVYIQIYICMYISSGHTVYACKFLCWRSVSAMKYQKGNDKQTH